ncbi:MAG: thermonuclease family protein, partial [Mesorhizobium sp.]
MIAGHASVVDGDTIEIHGERIRFNGVDAPESSQLCLDVKGKKYRCGS